MVKILTLQNIKITSWTVLIGTSKVHVHYDVVDDTGETIFSEEAFFFEVMPEDGFELPDGSTYTNQDNFYQLPLSYVQMLTDLTNDADTAITNRELGE